MSVSGYLGSGVPIPGGGSTIRISPNLTEVNSQYEERVYQYSTNEFLVPYLTKTVSAVFSDSFDVNLFRNAGGGEDESGLVDMKAKPPGEDTAAPGEKKKGAPGGSSDAPPAKKSKPADGDDKQQYEEEDEPAPGVGRFPKPVDKRKPGDEPTKRPPPPKYPETSRKGREQIPLAEEEKKHIRSVWTRSAKKFFEHLLIFGIAVVRTTTDQQTGKKLFYVVDHRKRTIYFTNNSLWPERRYFVHYNDRKAPSMRLDPMGKRLKDGDDTPSLKWGPSGGDGTGSDPRLLQDPTVTVQLNENNLGMETLDGSSSNMIFVLYEPTEDGLVTSPTALSMRHTSSLTFTRFTELFVNRGRALPLHVVAASGARNGGAPGSGGGTTGRETMTSTFVQGDATNAHDEFSYHEAEEQRRMYAIAAAQATRNNTTVGGREAAAIMARQDAAANQGRYTFLSPSFSAQTLEEIALQRAPYESHSLVLPPGQTMQLGPQPEGAPNFAAFIEWQKAELAMTWGIPPQVLDPQGSKYASDETIVMGEWENKRRDYSASLSNFLATIWSVSHAEDAKTFVKYVMKAIKTGETSIEGKGGVQYNVDLKREKSQFQDADMRAVNAVLAQEVKQKKEGIRKKIRKGFRVEVAFNMTFDSTDITMVDKIYSLNGMDTNTFLGILAAKAKIPRSLVLLTEEAREQQRATELQADRDKALASQPPPQPPGPDGKPLKAPPPLKLPAKTPFAPGNKK